MAVHFSFSGLGKFVTVVAGIMTIVWISYQLYDAFDKASLSVTIERSNYTLPLIISERVNIFEKYEDINSLKLALHEGNNFRLSHIDSIAKTVHEKIITGHETNQSMSILSRQNIPYSIVSIKNTSAYSVKGIIIDMKCQDGIYQFEDKEGLLHADNFYNSIPIGEIRGDNEIVVHIWTTQPCYEVQINSEQGAFYPDEIYKHSGLLARFIHEGLFRGGLISLGMGLISLLIINLLEKVQDYRARKAQ